MKRFGIVYLILAIMTLWSCIDDWNFSTSSRYKLSFSVDTVRFDTVFTGVVSATDGFMVYNHNDAGLRFDAIMGGGAVSPFRMNLDGEGGAVITELEIPAGDSLFCFISVNITPTDDPEPFNAFDSIRFVLESGEVQSIMLSAQGQNAVRLNRKRIETDAVLTSRLPYIITDTLFVAYGATLRLEPGTRLYFHQNAVLDVAGRIIAKGTPDSVITMRGDRLDYMLPDLPYSLLDGQWGGIILHDGSYDNQLEWCDIHGGNWGILADSAGSDQMKVSIVSSIIHNVSGNGIEATGCRIEVANSQITNAGNTCVNLAGGWSDFTFCTIAGFSLWNISSQAVLLTDSRDGSAVPFVSASFRNCIITGRHATEFTVTVADSIRNTAPYSVSNSLLMVQDSTDVRYRNVVFEDRSSKYFGSSNFVDHPILWIIPCKVTAQYLCWIPYRQHVV